MIKKVLVFILAIAVIAVANEQKNKKDDWEYDYNITKSQNSIHPRMLKTFSSPMMKIKSIGLSVGGAKDANNFYENIKNGYLPKLNSITYEGVFYDHYFKLPDSKKRDELFSPLYESYISKNPFTNEDEYFLSVGLDSNIDLTNFKRKKLNIVVVLDISGSMSSSFNRYYYDKNRAKNKENKSKISIAKESIVSMIDHLKDNDKFGVVLFDDKAYRAKGLRAIRYTDMDAIKKHILKLQPRGGTNWSAGYKAGINLFDSLKKEEFDKKEYENRIIFITDAMPNRGELNKDRLFGIAKDASNRGIYTTFIGVGVDFNNDLVEAVSKIKGSNYYSVHSHEEFKKRLDREFDYMVTPLVFDLVLKFKSDDYKIEKVYGSPNANLATNELMRVDTLFPSPTEDEGVKGGVILLKLKKIGNTNGDINLITSYKNRDEKSFTNSQKLNFLKSYANDDRSINKAILLARYVDLMKNYLFDMRRDCVDKVGFYPFESLKRRCLVPFSDDIEQHYDIKTWERRSCPLKISEGYKKIFSLFENYFKKQMSDIGDKSLEKELSVIKSLKAQKLSTHESAKKDDWEEVVR